MGVVIAILSGLLIIAVKKALQYYIGLCAYIRYTEEKEIIPTDKRIKELMMWATKNMFSDLFNRK